MSILLWLVGGIFPLHDVPKRSSLITGLPESEQELYLWANSTEKDALFAIPPTLENFRVQAQRAVVVDWKSVPFLPSDIIGWYARLETVCNAEGFTRIEAAEASYLSIGTSHMQRLVDAYDVDYVVLRREPTNHPSIEVTQRVFENNRFIVVAP